jgi:hypothetical protein
LGAGVYRQRHDNADDWALVPGHCDPTPVSRHSFRSEYSDFEAGHEGQELVAKLRQSGDKRFVLRGVFDDRKSGITKTLKSWASVSRIYRKIYKNWLSDLVARRELNHYPLKSDPVHGLTGFIKSKIEPAFSLDHSIAGGYS